MRLPTIKLQHPQALHLNLHSRAAAHRDLNPALCLAICFTCTFVFPTHASWISEIQPETRSFNLSTATEPVVIPPLIELSGMIATTQAELVVIDATNLPTRRGTILAVVPLGEGPDIRIVTPGPWPELLFPFGDTDSGAITAPAADLPLSGDRTLILFDRPTGLIAHSGTLDAAWPVIDGPVILDAVTYGTAPVPTEIVEDYPIQPAAPGQAIGQPMLTISTPWDALYLVGEPDSNGFMVGITPDFQLNPGLPNLVWPAETVPEPATGSILTIAAVLLIPRPARRSRRQTCPVGAPIITS